MSLPAAANPVTFVLTAYRARTMAFYSEVLGLTIHAAEDFGVVFNLGARRCG
jgi:hypothetical protein